MKHVFIYLARQTQSVHMIVLLAFQRTLGSLPPHPQFSSDVTSFSKPFPNFRNSYNLYKLHPPCPICFKAAYSYLWHRPHHIILQFCLLILIHQTVSSFEPFLHRYLNSEHVAQCAAQRRCPANVCKGRIKKCPVIRITQI